MPAPWPHDDTKSCIDYYGNPQGGSGRDNPLWKQANLVEVTPPWHMVAAWDPTSTIHSFDFHKKAAPALTRVLNKIWSVHGQDQKKIEKMGLHLFGGTYAFRLKRGLNSLSVHSFGAAIDLDPKNNPLGVPWKPGMMDQSVVAAFIAEQATWGGSFKSRPDCMHFQFAYV